MMRTSRSKTDSGKPQGDRGSRGAAPSSGNAQPRTARSKNSQGGGSGQPTPAGSNPVLERLRAKGLLGPDVVLIMEKPDAGKKVAAVFGGKGWEAPIETAYGKVMWMRGHAYRDVEPEEIDPVHKVWRQEPLPINPDAWPRVLDGKMRSIVAAVRAALKGAKRVIIATDYDRAGEAIGRDVLDDLKWRGPVSRLPLVGLDERSILDAFEAMESGAIDAAAIEAWAIEERCRSEADCRLGFNGTRIATLALRPSETESVWSVGGVQGGLVALIGHQERARAGFVPTPFYEVEMTVDVAASDVGPAARVSLVHAPGVEHRILDREAAVAVLERARSWKGPLRVEKNEKRIEPRKFLQVDTFQAACVRSLGIGPNAAMDIGQGLYDKGLISYTRAIGDAVQESQAARAESLVPGLAGRFGIPDPGEPVIRRGSHYVRSDDPRVQPHGAIIPLRLPSPGDGLSDIENAVYDVIARSYLMSHMPAGIDAVTEITALVGKSLFATTGTVTLSAGWRILRTAGADEERKGSDPRTDKVLPIVGDGAAAAALSAQIFDKKTQAPNAYGFADLPSIMGRLIDHVPDHLKLALKTDDPTKPRGLGTPATRADMIRKVVLDRNYVEIRHKGIVLTPAETRKLFVIDKKNLTAGKGKSGLTVHLTVNGWAFLETWEAVDPWVVDISARAELEAELQKIGSAGNRDQATTLGDAFMQRYRRRVDEMVARAKSAPRSAGRPIMAEGWARTRPAQPRPAPARTAEAPHSVPVTDVGSGAAPRTAADAPPRSISSSDAIRARMASRRIGRP